MPNTHSVSSLAIFITLMTSPQLARAQADIAIWVTGGTRAARQSAESAARAAFEADRYSVSPSSAVKSAMRFTGVEDPTNDQQLRALREAMDVENFVLFQLKPGARTYAIRARQVSVTGTKVDFEEAEKSKMKTVVQRLVKRLVTARPSTAQPAADRNDQLSAQIVRLGMLEQRYASESSIAGIRIAEIIGYSMTGIGVVLGVASAATLSGDGDCEALGVEECTVLAAVSGGIGVAGLALGIPMSVSRSRSNRRAAALKVEIDEIQRSMRERPTPPRVQLSAGPRSARLAVRF